MKILIVDDDKTNLLVLSAMLKKEGHNVISASNGLEAVSLFEESQPELILMDVMMPEMDGYQAARIIKEKSQNDFIPVIFITAVTDENALAKCVESGGDDFLTKPYSRVILNSKISSFSRIKQLYQTVSVQRNELDQLNQQIQSDIELAKHVFSSIVERSSRTPEKYSCWLKPASSFSGDIVIAAENSAGGYNILVGDFTGHGMAAALGAIPVTDLFYSMSEKGYKIEDIVTELNEKVSDILPTGYFCAASVISFDKNHELASIWNGGLPNLYITDCNGNLINKINSEHTPLGITKYSPDTLIINQIDIKSPINIYAYTDGLTDVRNKSGIYFGAERLLEILLENDHRENIDFLPELFSEFMNKKHQDDDISIVRLGLSPSVSDEQTNLLKSIDNHPFDWDVSITLNSDAIKYTDPVATLMNFAMDLKIPRSHRDRIYTVIAELFNNALEHGILGLQSTLKETPEGFDEYYRLRAESLNKLQSNDIQIYMQNKVISNDSACFIFKLNYMGEGFDYDKYLSNLQQSDGNSGRGILLVKSLCSKLEYGNKGTSVLAEYSWSV